MPEDSATTDGPRPPVGFRFTSGKLFGCVAAISIGLLPTAYFGWQGIISTVFLTLAGLLVTLEKPKLAVALIVMLCTGQLFYPAIDGAREAILRSECENGLKTIAMAILNYENDHGYFPPAYTIDANGNPLHSWRVTILPYLNKQELYDQIDLTVPWDDPRNRPFHDKMPALFCCGAVRYHSRWHTTGNTTAYVAVLGDKTMWPSDGTARKLKEVSDSTHNTIVVIESEADRTPWMSPVSPKIETFFDSLDFHQPHNGLIHATFVDGSTGTITQPDVDEETLSAFLLINDRRIFDNSSF